MVGSVLAVGTVHVGVLLAIAPVGFAAAVVALLVGRARWRDLPAPAFILILLGLYSALQAVPIPASWLAAVAPPNADVWARSLHGFGEAGPSRASISLDPGASLVESLKWLLYAAVFIAAARLGRDRGARPVVTLIFAAGLTLALTTLGHGMAGAETVFGIYEPKQAGHSWALSPLLNPNNLAGYLNLALFSGLGLLFADRLVLPRWLLGLSVACMVGVTVVSASRGGVLALILGSVVVTFTLAFASRTRRRRHRRKRSSPAPGAHLHLWAPLGATLLGGLILALLGANDQVWQGLLDESTEKLALWEWTRPLVDAHPWWGVGRGAFETAFPPYQQSGHHVIYAYAENFIAQWVSEWGIPVGLGALLALAWLLRPSRLREPGDLLSAAACVGVSMLLLQNFVDLALEITSVAIAMATLLGGLWGARQRKRREPFRLRDAEGEAGDPGRSEPPERGGLLGWGWSTVLTLLGVGAMVATALGDMHPALDERAALDRRYLDTDFSDPSARSAFYAQLRAALGRHPGDPYLPLVGAFAARSHPGGTPLRWLTRALERDPGNGLPHLTLAETLARLGARNQALLELRLAVERTPGLAGKAATVARRLTDDPDLLHRAVPAGPDGAPMLTEVARRLDRVKQPVLRRTFTEEAIARNLFLVAPRQLEADDLLATLKSHEPPDRCADPAWCIARIEDHIRALDELAPDSANAIVLRAELLTLQERPAEAEHLLAENCGRYRNAVGCWRARVVAADTMPDGERLGDAMASYLASACSRPGPCAGAADWLASLLVRRQDWTGAAAKYERAAREEPTARRWLRLAEMAARAGQTTRARQALRRAERLADDSNSKQVKRVEEQLRQILLRDLSSTP